MTSRTNRTGALAGATIALLLASNPVVVTLEAQQPAGAPAVATGRITGRVVDAESGMGLTDVGVQVVGTTIGTMSGVDGRFTLPRVPAGTVTLMVRRIGYAPKTITGILLPANGAVEQNVALSQATVQLQAQVVTATAERGTVNEALDRQRTATGIVNAVTSEQIARSPDSDAAAAVQRVSGVTVQDGRNVFVRGLGERYTTTTLNGARLPSPDPEKRSVPLDLFPAGLLQTITTSKTFTPDLAGDFSGAQVDIQTREFPARRQVQLSTSFGVNDAVLGTTLPRAQRAGGELFGLAGGDRGLPATLDGVRNPSVLTQDQQNAVIRSFRNTWTTEQAGGAPNGSFGASVGGQDPVLGHPVGYLLSGSYSLSSEARRDLYTANPQLTESSIVPLESWRGTSGRTSVLWGGLANFSTMVGTRSRLALNNTFNRSADLEATVDEGSTFAFSEEFARRSTQRYVERTVLSSQLAAQHALSDRHNLDWNVTYAGVNRDEPDRIDVVYQQAGIANGERQYAFAEGNTETTRRTFGALSETSVGGGANYRLLFGDAARGANLKFGALARRTARDATVDQFSIYSLGFISAEDRRLSPERLFNGPLTADGASTFRVQGTANGGDYEASDRNVAGYGMIEYPIGEHLRVIGGARVENALMEVNTARVDGGTSRAELDNTDVLPSLILNMKLGETHNLRVSATQTLARPEYRELSDAIYLDVLGNGATRGNPALVRSLIQNYDIRWERYPSPGELFSVALFAKTFQDPIERVDEAQSGAQIITFANAERAVNYGLEIELRQGLGNWIAPLRDFTTFSNVTLMTSEITLRGGTTNLTSSDRPMVGQAPYVVNAGMTYARESGISATLLYNVVGKRIFAAGTGFLGDIYEMPRNVLDLSLRFPVAWNLSGRIDARNLFDAEYRLEQSPSTQRSDATGTIVRQSYRTGRVFSAGLTWRP